MKGSTQAESEMVAEKAAKASVADGGAEVIYVSDGGERFAIESEWLGSVIEVAQEHGYIVDTISAMGENAEVLFKRA